MDFNLNNKIALIVYLLTRRPQKEQPFSDYRNSYNKPPGGLINFGPPGGGGLLERGALFKIL